MRRPSAARSPATSPCAPTSRRGRMRARAASGRCAIRGTARRKTCIPHGSRSSSTRRSTRSRRGRRCMKCCAIDRAISCSIYLGLGEDEIGHHHSPRLRRPCRTFCAPISPSRWGCRSATRIARAAAAASRRSASQWFEHPECRAARPPPSRTASPPRRHRLLLPFRRASPQPRRAGPAAGHAAAAEAAGARARRSAIICASRRRRRPFRIRREPRLTDDNTDYLSGAADAGDAAPGDRLCRSVRARFDARAARAADRRRGRRLPRRRRAARRHGRAQALLARQFPVRAGSRARRPRASSASGRSCATRTAPCGG